MQFLLSLLRATSVNVAKINRVATCWHLNLQFAICIAYPSISYYTQCSPDRLSCNSTKTPVKTSVSEECPLPSNILRCAAKRLYHFMKLVYTYSTWVVSRSHMIGDELNAVHCFVNVRRIFSHTASGARVTIERVGRPGSASSEPVTVGLQGIGRPVDTHTASDFGHDGR